jgi:prevent-host-death family protein
MTTLTTSQARAQLFQLVDAALISHKPVQIKGRRASAVLISSEDWEAIQETLYLLSAPGMRESLVKNMKTPLAKCSKKPPW